MAETALGIVQGQSDELERVLDLRVKKDYYEAFYLGVPAPGFSPLELILNNHQNDFPEMKSQLQARIQPLTFTNHVLLCFSHFSCDQPFSDPIWGFPGKGTGVVCHFLLKYIHFVKQ